MQWIRDNLKIVVPGAVVGLAALAYLAFGVFGIQTLFIDDEVSEDVPVFASGAGASGLPSDAVDEAEAAEMNKVMVDERTPVEAEVADPMPEAATPELAVEGVTDETGEETGTEPAAAPAEIVTVLEGSFVPRSHPGEGTAKVLNDGTEQRFVRFEDFRTDNGPDLNVYLTKADADADADAFGRSGDFVDLGDLKGNVGPQNYEIPPDVDLAEFDTVVVWCVRFGVAFTAADLS